MILVDNITKVYGAQKALDGVSFSVQRGEVLGLLGPNGAGKSTLMKILTGYLAPTAGKAVVNGFDLSQQSLEARRTIGYLPENNPLYPDLYVREYLKFMGGLHKLGRRLNKRVGEVIESVGITAEQHKKIGQLSKGYRQRVGLAQALLHEPPVLILDEPTTGLDPNQIIEIRQLISGLGRERTILFSTHIMQEVEAVCNRIVIIHQGKLATDMPLSKATGNASVEKIFRELTKK
ncbi:MAG: ATP-binding cassette domain-containing protein [Prevotellaceae bacterium]|jgi:ABC-2 type transport system ATP-binding protein|nr:ATP-binding cassette domain-containing protein [Prevotellaceae bacterium]